MIKTTILLFALRVMYRHYPRKYDYKTYTFNVFLFIHHIILPSLSESVVSFYVRESSPRPPSSQSLKKTCGRGLLEGGRLLQRVYLGDPLGGEHREVSPAITTASISSTKKNSLQQLTHTIKPVFLIRVLFHTSRTLQYEFV